MTSCEIVKTVNGYIVRPPYDYYRNEGSALDFKKEVYVFNDYQKMMDKLHELLNPEEYPK